MFPPNAKLTRVSDAAVEPVTLDEAKQFLRMEPPDQFSSEDDLVSALITAARLWCENYLDRSLINTTWRLTLDHLPFSAGYGGALGMAISGLPILGACRPDDGSIYLPMPPLVSVESIEYADQAGIVRSLDVTPQGAQVIVSPGTPGRIAPAFGTFFPFSRPQISAVDITYVAGYGPDGSSVPMNIRLAIRLLVSHYYEHRTTGAAPPEAIAGLLDASRWGGYA